MTSELKLCPFCGTAPGISKSPLTGYWWVSCDNDACNIQPATFGMDSLNNAVEAWNTRAERTCRNVYDEDGLGNCFNGFTCSECGGTVEDYEGYKVRGIWNYCPYCRAKVVSE